MSQNSLNILISKFPGLPLNYFGVDIILSLENNFGKLTRLSFLEGGDKVGKLLGYICGVIFLKESID